MANAKRKRPSAISAKRKWPTGEPTFEWSAKEMGHLFAWLDLKYEYGVGREVFKDAAVSYLTEKWHRDFSWNVLDNKIKNVHSVGYRDDDRKYKNRKWMMEIGTTSLVDDKYSCRYNQKTIEAFEIGEQLRQNEQFREDFRQRTGSRSISAAMPRGTPTTRSQTVNDAMDVASDNPVEATTEKTLVLVLKRRKRHNSDSPSSLSTVPSSDSGLRAESNEPTIEQNAAVPDSEASGADNEIEMLSAPSGSQPAVDTVQNTVAGPSLRARTATPSPRVAFAQKQCKVLDCEATIRELTDSRDYFKSECVRLCNELAEVKEKLDNETECWQNVQKDRDLKRALHDQQMRILSQDKELSEVKTLAKFVQPLNDFTREASLQRIKRQFDDIANDTEKAFDEYTSSVGDLTDRISGAPEMEALLQRVLGSETDEGRLVTRISERTKGLSMHSIVRAIIAAALSEWVFESDWPNFDDHQCPLLRGFRKCLALQEGGSRALEVAEFVAHDLLMREAAFEEYTLVDKARDVQRRLCCTLSALLSQKADITNADKLLLQNVVRGALRLKSTALTIGGTVTLRTAKPGTAFDQELMQAEIDGNGGQHLSSDAGRSGISTEDLVGGGSLHRHEIKLVDACEERQSGFKVLTKAVVLLE